jgi:hypothetical protein
VRGKFVERFLTTRLTTLLGRKTGLAWTPFFSRV